MPFATPFYERTKPLCISHKWKEWAGFYAVCTFETPHDREYFAFRHSCGLIDVSPLFKYDIKGPDAAKFLSAMMTRSVDKLKQGQVIYTPWCTDQGKVVDDGTITRMGEDFFRVTAALPNYSWFTRHAGPFNITIEDTSEKIGALSLQGPTSRATLANATQASLDDLKFFQSRAAKISGADVWISRTGYTGDLGYEVWCNPSDANKVWDGIMAGGKNHGIQPAGLDSMDITRIEAGFVLNGVDYYSAPLCHIERRKSTPFELNLGWAVQTDRAPFMGQEALIAEKATGPSKHFVGIEINWDQFEGKFAKWGLPPEVPSHAWRTAVPLYNISGNFIGQATSGTWSPLLKKYIALATVDAGYHTEGTRIQFEITVEYRRELVEATVQKIPFFNPERKRS